MYNNSTCTENPNSEVLMSSQYRTMNCDAIWETCMKNRYAKAYMCLL